MHKIGAISIDASLRILAGTRSGPAGGFGRIEVTQKLYDSWHGKNNI